MLSRGATRKAGQATCLLSRRGPSVEQRRGYMYSGRGTTFTTGRPHVQQEGPYLKQEGHKFSKRGEIDSRRGHM
jgi:hypothetical protein